MAGRSLIEFLRATKLALDTEQEASFNLSPDATANAVREFYLKGDRLGISDLYGAFCEMLAASRGMSQAESIRIGGSYLDNICWVVDFLFEAKDIKLSPDLLRHGYRYFQHTFPGPVRSFYREIVHYQPTRLLQPPVY